MTGPSPLPVPAALAEYLGGSRLPLTLSPVSDRNHRLAFANEALAELTGYPVEEIVGRNCRFLQAGARDQPARQAIRRFLETDQPQVTTQIVNFRKDGTPFVNLLIMLRLYDRNRQPRYILGSQYDISGADEDGLMARHGALQSQVQSLDAAGRENRLSMIGSVKALGQAAGQIAQARLMLSEL